MKKRLLFVCDENSSRSPMAEALARIWAQGAVEAASAGLEPGPRVHPEAVAVMQELGYDMSSHRPTRVPDAAGEPVDVLVTLGCDVPPTVPAHRMVRWSIPDPAGGDTEMFRTVRDVLAERIRRLLGPGITITRDCKSLKARLIASQAKPVPMRVAAALAYRQLVGRLPQPLKEGLNDAAYALSQVIDVYYTTMTNRLRRIPASELACGRFENGGEAFLVQGGPVYRSISVRRADLVDGIDKLRRGRAGQPAAGYFSSLTNRSM